MNDLLQIPLDEVKEDRDVSINIISNPHFLDVNESDFTFNSPVEIRGSASLSGDSIILNLAIVTEVTMACAICNENVQVKIEIPHFHHVEERGKIKGGLFSFRDEVRDSILLELPYRAECNGGSCRERASLAKFLKQ